MSNPESIQPTRSILEEEIHSQPALLAQFLAREGAHIAALSGLTAGCDYVVIAARGSSDHAAIYASYLFAQLAGLPVSLATPALYSLYHTPPRLRGALALGISQSGQSPDIVAVLREARAQGRPTLAITNDPTSPLAQTADHVIALGTGIERSVAATKTYTAQLLAVAALAAAWSGRADAQAALTDIGPAAARTLAQADTHALAARLAAANRCIVVGRGYGFPTALEWALKLKESDRHPGRGLFRRRLPAWPDLKPIDPASRYPGSAHRAGRAGAGRYARSVHAVASAEGRGVCGGRCRPAGIGPPADRV